VALAFRNLAVTPDAPVSSWPTEAVQTALERGDLADWHRIVAEIGADPWGRTARQVEEVLCYSRPYGVAEAMEAALSRARERAEASERAAVAAEIREALRCSGLSRAEFASRVGTSASRLSTYASGKVTPSATMMLRIRRAAERPARLVPSSCDPGQGGGGAEPGDPPAGERSSEQPAEQG
jgi:DNA-binding transcriptional regulator YiaG